MKIKETDTVKLLSSPDYNYVFNKKTGLFMRWGRTTREDPDYSPFGPEIADIEISTICGGLRKPCPWCYKGNTEVGKNMSFETFVKVFNKLPRTLTQIAFGIGDLNANPDLFNIMEHCRKNEVIPNITINGYDTTTENKQLSDNNAFLLGTMCGAIAVSHYNSDDICFNAINKLGEYLKQVNIHKILSEETFDECIELIDKAKHDIRLSKLNAIVFLLLKEKGSRNKLHTLHSLEKFEKLYDYAKEKGISIGFDSCSAPSFLQSLKGKKDFEYALKFAEPCESLHFSIYINVKGKIFPCSFCEGEDFEPVDILEVENFEEFWNGEYVKSFRDSMKKDDLGSRQCPVFDLSLRSKK